MNPTFFGSAEEFRNWLADHHETETEILVGFHKVKSGKAPLTWSESVDAALSFGWIDAVRKSIDKERYFIRFTRRKKNSIWSLVNLKKVETLIASGQMHSSGLAVYESRNRAKEGIYSFEQPGMPEFGPEELALLKSNPKAWEFFQAQPPWFRKLTIHRVSQPKREETRKRRLEQMIADCEAGIRYDPYRWRPPKAK